MRIPTFSRQSGATRTADDEPTLVDTPPVSPRTDPPPPPAPRTSTEEPTVRNRPVVTERSTTTDRVTTDRVTTAPPRTAPVATEPAPTAPPAPLGPRPRASLLATLGLVTGVASALLVLSGPLAGYGIGLAGLALVLSLGGISATGRRHVAGKSDAILGMILALGAIVIGVLALTGSLHWLSTDLDSASRLREWLDAQFAQRF